MANIRDQQIRSLGTLLLVGYCPGTGFPSQGDPGQWNTAARLGRDSLVVDKIPKNGPHSESYFRLQYSDEIREGCC